MSASRFRRMSRAHARGRSDSPHLATLGLWLEFSPPLAHLSHTVSSRGAANSLLPRPRDAEGAELGE